MGVLEAKNFKQALFLVVIVLGGREEARLVVRGVRATFARGGAVGERKVESAADFEVREVDLVVAVVNDLAFCRLELLLVGAIDGTVQYGAVDARVAIGDARDRLEERRRAGSRATLPVLIEEIVE